MNTEQFYYIHKVLGVSSFIQPKDIRAAYKLHNYLYKNTPFLFFCSHLDSNKKKLLIKKMALSLNYTNTMIIEVLNIHHPHISNLLNNFLTRFVPKGFVIFGYDLASCLDHQSPQYLQNKKILWNNKISGAVLNPLSNFTDSNPSLVKKYKLQAWDILKELYII